VRDQEEVEGIPFLECAEYLAAVGRMEKASGFYL